MDRRNALALGAAGGIAVLPATVPYETLPEPGLAEPVWYLLAGAALAYWLAFVRWSASR